MEDMENRIQTLERNYAVLTSALTAHTAEMTADMKKVKEHLDRQDENTKLVSDALLGSFTKKEPGLVESVRKLTSSVSQVGDSVAQMKKADASTKKTRFNFVQAILVAAITVVFGAVVQHYVH